MYSFSYTLIYKTTYIISNNFCTNRKSYYDVLNLPRDCTAKQIKESFIKLSKQNHPDINKNTDAHSKFLAINESYKVLSNIETRRNYDLGLIPHRSEVNYSNQKTYRSPRNEYWYDTTFYTNRDRSQDYKYTGRPYYGIFGQEKVSNVKIVAICLTLVGVIVALQVLAITKSVTFQREELLRKSKEAEDSLNDLKKTVELNGNELQIKLLNLKFAEQEKLKKRNS